MREPEHERSRARIEPWELELIRKVARAFRTSDRDELEAELASRLLALKSRPRTLIRRWDAYVAKFLYNKASNWIRSQRLREHKTQSYDSRHLSDPEQTFGEPPSEEDDDTDAALALTAVWEGLDRQLRVFWQVLLEEQGNQSKAARRLNIHRNTARLWKERILEALSKHGFVGP